MRWFLAMALVMGMGAPALAQGDDDAPPAMPDLNSQKGLPAMPAPKLSAGQMDALKKGLDALPEGQLVMLKLTLPNEDDLYAEFTKHPRVLKVVALSGGYSRADANAKLARQHGMVASFSRALTEGLTAQQSDAEFNAALDQAIQSIYDASKT